MKNYGIEELEVRLGERSYPISFGENMEGSLLLECEKYLEQGCKVVGVFDEGLTQANPTFYSALRDKIPFISVPSGEATKSIAHLGAVWDFLASQKLDRSSVLFAFGGGVTGDLAGFAAASYLRGISFYQVPTTLLAMVDSSVGGKTGINLISGKNLVGSFHQPKGVFIDLECLQTLPVRQFSAGMAEVIKYGMLGNGALYDNLIGRPSPLDSSSEDLVEVIVNCCSDKARIVEFDERETGGGKGGRALLNLGHTFAHAIEAVSGYGKYLHGEAVAVGLVCALRLSLLLGGCKDEDEPVLLNLLQSYDLPVALRENLSLSELMKVMQSDKKVKAGKLRFVLMREIGSSYLADEVEAGLAEKVWSSVGAL